jgi:homocysteine S-methyltransferase
MAKPNFLKYVKENVVLGDGAMGTQLYEKGVFLNRCFDEINVTDPQLVRQVHRDYIRAGSQLIETNTFGANPFKLEKYHLEDRCAELNIKAVELAREEAGEEVWVAGAMGPLGVRIEPWGKLSLEEAREAFKVQAEALLEGGVDLIILETFGDLSEIGQAISAVKDLTDKPVVAQMTVTEDGSSLYGTRPEVFTARLEEWGADVVGLNCSVGPQVMLTTLEEMAGCTTLPLSVQPNAGTPRAREGRVFYLASPDYFAKYAHRFIRAGARLMGGCCGTTPEHIKAMASVVRMKQHTRVERSKRPAPCQADELEKTKPAKPTGEKSGVGRKIASGEPVFTIELTPPRGWDMTKVLSKARRAKQAGFDAVNIPDGPRASARMAVVAAALRVQQDVGIEPIIHYVCRDRNLLGMQSDLLGAYALGMPNFLLLTGDPPVMGDYPQSTPVFDVDSIGLTNLAQTLNRGVDLGQRSIGKPTGFLIGVGVNPTAVNLELEIERLYWKIDAGAEYAISQPVFDPAALVRFLDQSNEYLDSHGLKPVPIVAGLWPLQSLKNAEFLKNEVPGITIPDSIMTRMQRAGSKEKEREVGMEVAREQIRDIVPHVAGFQLSAPFGRVKPAVELMRYALELWEDLKRPKLAKETVR